MRFIYWDGQFTVVYANYVTVFEILLPWLGTGSVWFWANVVSFECVIVLVLWSHWMAALTEPGYVRRRTAVEEATWPSFEDVHRQTRMKPRFCRKCQSVKPARAHHCSICNRCTMKMDHHCPWINNCLGQNSHKFFLQFVFYVCVGSIHAALILISHVAWCYQTKTCGKPTTGRVVLGAVALVLEIFFCIFVISMMCDQFEALRTDTTGIEAMKGWAEKDLTLWQGLSNVMGPPSFWWLIPVMPPTTHLYDGTPPDRINWHDIRDPEYSKHITKLRQIVDVMQKKEDEEKEEGSKKPSARKKADKKKKAGAKEGAKGKGKGEGKVTEVGGGEGEEGSDEDEDGEDGIWVPEEAAQAFLEKGYLEVESLTVESHEDGVAVGEIVHDLNSSKKE